MKLKICVALLVLCLAAVSLFADNAPQQASAVRKAEAAFGALPLSFEPTATSGRYLSRSGRYAISLGASDSTIAVTDKSGTSRMLRFAFENSNAKAQLQATDALPGVTNYYLGNDSRNWRLGVRNFAKVHAKGVYPGVDVVYYGNNRHLEFDFVVAPGASPTAIAMTFSGMDTLKTNGNGALVADLDGRTIAFEKPIAYQMIAGARKPVTAEYVLADNKARLRLGDYDKSRELVIDPVISYSFYMGGTQTDEAKGIAVNAQGEAFITGQTCSTDFYMPTPNLSLNDTFTGSCDAFVTKLDKNGTAVLFTTLIGGTSPDNAAASSNAIALDKAASQNVYIAGTTNFWNLPVTPNDPLSRSSGYGGGDSDAFVFILSASDGSLVRGTYLGGQAPEEAYAIAVDSQQNVVVAGQTRSIDFPAYNSFQAKTEAYVAFVTKLDFGLHVPNPIGPGASAMSPRPPSLSDACVESQPCPLTPDPTKTYYFSSTLFGGQLVPPLPTWSYTEGVTFAPGAIIIGTPDKAPAQILIAEGSCTAQGLVWPETVGEGKAVPDLCGTMVWRIIGAMKTPVYASTEAYGVAVDPIGDIFAVGATNTEKLEPWSFYAGTGPWILKVKADGERIYSTALANVAADATSVVNAARAVAVDTMGRAYVVGTATGGVYTSPGGKYPAPIGKQDGFAIRINTTGSSIDYGTYLGGTGNDQALSVAVDNGGWAYIGGLTQSADLPVINELIDRNGNAFQQLRGVQDAYIAKLSPDGANLNMSAFFGGSGTEQVNGIAISNGDIYITGRTDSADMPVYPVTNPLVPGFTRRAGAGTTYDGFVAKILGSSFPNASLSLSSLNFPDQVIGTTSPSQTVSLRNTGAGPLSIAGITISGEYFQTNDCGNGLTAVGGTKDTCTITITFSPTGAGTRTGVLSVADNAPDSPQTVGLTGKGVLISASVTPSSLNFGSQALSTTSSAQMVTIKNNDATQVLSISGVTITGTGFLIDSNTCGSTLQPGATCIVGVTFTPAAQGAHTGGLHVAGNGSIFPFTVQLQGVGALVSATVTPTNLVFDSQTLDQASTPKTIRITNTDATQTLVIATPTFTGTTEFTISSNTCGTSVAHGASCDIAVVFKPTISGNRTGTLNLTGNGSNFPMTIQLQGTGAQPAAGSAGDFSISGPAGNILTIPAGQTQTVDISAVGTGTGFNGTVSLTCTVPAPATCGLNPAALTLTGTTPSVSKLTVVVPGSKSPNPKGAFNRMQRTLGPVFAFCLIGLTLIGRHRRVVLFAAIILGLCVVLVMSGCGGGGSGTNYSSDTGMLPGSYQMSVTATYTGTTTVTHTSNFTLKVQ